MSPMNLDIKAAAEYLGISWHYLDKIKCQKLDPDNSKLVRYVRHGKRILFPKEELDRYNEDLKCAQWQEST